MASSVCRVISMIGSTGKSIAKVVALCTTLTVLSSATVAAMELDDSRVTKAAAASVDCPALFQHKMKQLHSSQTLDLCEVVNGRPVLLVNTASHCGFTGQFADLERIHNTYKSQGLVVIGVASDSFNQEANSEGDIAEICYKNFGVSFTMLAPVSVKGESAHPLYQAVAEQESFPSWNFFKYLIDRNGQVVSANSSFRIPTDAELQALLVM